MVVSVKDPLESFLDSVKNALSPVELNLRKVTKNLEHCFNEVSKYGNLGVSFDDSSDELREAQLDLKKNNKVVDQRSFNRKLRRKSRVSDKVFVGILEEKDGSNVHGDPHVSDNWLEKLNVSPSRKGSKERYGSYINGEGDWSCLHLGASVLFFIDSFEQVWPGLIKSKEKWVQQARNGDIFTCNDSHVKSETKSGVVGGVEGEKRSRSNNGKDMSFEIFIGFFDQLNHLAAAKVNQLDPFRTFLHILEGKRAYVNGFLRNLQFARVGGVPSSVAGAPSVKDVACDGAVNQEETRGSSLQKLANGLLGIPMSNVERLRLILSTVSLMELIQILPQIGKQSKEDYPDKKKLCSVQDFFRYTEAEGKRFFMELDRDGDGQVTLEDLEVAIRRRNLPRKYAQVFMRRTKSHLFAKSFGWNQFLSLMEQNEPTILRAYTSLCLNKSGTLQKSEILASLHNAGLPANEDNAVAMMRFLNADMEKSISYAHFRNFMLLLPSERLQEDPRSIWFEAATVVAVPPPVEIPTTSVLKSALAGGLSCAFSTAVMHPVDTVKTRVQASTLSFPEILAKLPEIGPRGLYMGSIPAILGQFSSHGLRMGIHEASKLLLINVAPDIPELQVQSIASFCSTVLGTAARIPCEVLKQRLQAGLVNNVGEAIIETWQKDGLRGFFRGTGVTLCREVPFYVAGMGLYAESKKAVRCLLGRELEPWETIVVGALSGGLTAVSTTPFDVIKTRMMTAPQGRQVTLTMVALSILRREGPLGLFKGAVPRFFWIAPLGAINFAGYELARKALDGIGNNETGEPLLQK